MPHWLKRVLLALVCTAGVATSALAAPRAALDIDDAVHRVALWSSMHVYKAADRDLHPAQVAARMTDLNALPVQSPEQIFGRSGFTYWGAAAVRNPTAKAVEKILTFEATTVFDVRLFMRRDSLDWQEVQSWSKRSQGALGSGTIYPVWVLELPPAQTVELMLRVESPSIVRFPVFANSLEKYILDQRKFHLMAGITLGIFLFIGVYIVSVKRQWQEPSVPLFAVILVADLVGALWLSGVLSELFPAVSESILSPIGFAAYATLFGCGCWHARLYLRTDDWAPRASRVLVWFGYLWLFLAVWFALVFPGGARILLVWGGTCTALLVVSVSILAARKGVRFSGYEAATWLTSLVFVMSYLLARAFSQPLFWSSSSLALVQATVIAILYGVAMSQHIQRQRDEMERLQKEAVLQREIVAARLRERSLIYAATNHDLRQPLMGVGVFADLLKSAQTLEQRTNFAGKLDLAIGEVNDILLSLQQLSIVNEQVDSLELETVALTDVLKPMVEEYRNRAQYKNITIRYVPSKLLIRTHIPYIQRIVRNVLSNAIRYSAPGGRIVVGCRHGGGLRLVIADNGPGMEGPQIEQAFEPLTQFSSEAVREGSGLGLFSTKTMADALGTQVSLISRKNAGTVFLLQLRSFLPDKL